jgi:type IV pilus assembly protein PilP
VRRAIPWIAALVLVAVACDRRTTGPTVTEYREKRASVIAKHKERRAKLAESATKPAAEGQRGAAPGGFGTVERSYGYDSTGKRDPFRSFILDRLNEEGKQAKGPLEEYDLSQLAVVGVVWDAERPRALVEDPSGRGYVVQQGTAMGKNDGRVISIDDNLVLVRETYVDYVGDKTTKDIPMRIRQGREG